MTTSFIFKAETISILKNIHTASHTARFGKYIEDDFFVTFIGYKKRNPSNKNSNLAKKNSIHKVVNNICLPIIDNLANKSTNIVYQHFGPDKEYLTEDGRIEVNCKWRIDCTGCDVSEACETIGKILDFCELLEGAHKELYDPFQSNKKTEHMQRLDEIVQDYYPEE